MGCPRLTPNGARDPERERSSRRVCSAINPPMYAKMTTMRYPFVPIPKVEVRASTKPRMYATMKSLYGARNGRMLEAPSLTTIGRDATKAIWFDAKVGGYATFAI